MKSLSKFTKDVELWMEFARYDIKTAAWNLEGKIYTSSCYAAQQAAEKALKALLLNEGVAIPKVHSLDRLISELKKHRIDVSEIEQDAQLLDRYYISTRYPGQYGGPEGLYDVDDATGAVFAAKRILEFVER